MDIVDFPEKIKKILATIREVKRKTKSISTRFVQKKTKPTPLSIHSGITETTNSDLTPVDNSMFLINDFNKLTQVKYEVKEYKTKKELKSVLEYNSDLVILNNLDITLVKDFQGVLRFKEVPLSTSSEMIRMDLNKAFEHFFINRIYTLKEMMLSYIESGSSVNSFMEVFDKYFTDEDNNQISKNDIVKIIEGVLEVRDFDRDW